MRLVIPPRRQHPVSMLRYAFRYLFLLTLPLLRGLRYIRIPEGLYPWIPGIWRDAAAILLLIALVYVHWRWHTYSLTDHEFRFRGGILLRRNSTIPRRHITTLTVERPFYLRLFRAARIIVDTDAGDRYRADLTLTVSEKHAREILAARQALCADNLRHYRARLHHVVVLSLLGSDLTFSRRLYPAAP